MPQMNRFNLVFLIIFFTFLLPGPPSTPINSDDQYNKLILFKNQLYQSYTLFQNNTFSQNFGNLTGFQLSYQDVLDGQQNETYPIPGKDYEHWENNQEYSILPNDITQLAESIWNLENDSENAHENYYKNISSSLFGNFTNDYNETNFKKLPLELPTYLQGYDQDLNSELPSSLGTSIGNITLDSGSVRIDVSVVDQLNKHHFNPLDSQIKLINIDLEFLNDDETIKHSIETKGFYFVESGNIITSTNSAKFLSFFGGLQHLTLNNENYELSKNLSLNYLEETLFKTLNPVDNIDINFNYLYQMIQSSENHCEFVNYFHLNRVNLTNDEIQDLDQELSNPIGRPIKFDEIPKLNLSGVLYSPDCAIQLNIPSAVGVKKEILIFKLHKVILMGIGLLLAQIFLIMKQMNQTNTPSTISRVSFWSICLMSLVDGSLSMLFLLSSAVLNKLYLPLTVSAFLSFILASIFEMRYMISIYVSQLNERSLSIFTALQGRSLDDENQDGATTTNTATNNNTNNVQDESQVSGAIYSRFFFTLIVFTFLILNSVMWPKHLRRNFEYVVLIILNSYWLPQVYRNVIRGSRHSFEWWFIGGTTLLRLIPLSYVFTDEDNVFQHHHNPIFFGWIVRWYTIQILPLFLQSLYGPRFFLPKLFLPKAYDYHPILTESDLESGFGIVHHNHDVNTNETTTTINRENDGDYTIDCAICMNPVKLCITKSHADQALYFTTRRTYMVTPCKHIFHFRCLEAWMQYKLQCPVCRSPLPPL